VRESGAPGPARTAIVGVGNTLMGDDGVGVQVARSLLGEGPLPDGVEVVLGETAGMALLPYFRECRSVIFVDAIDAGAEPGAVFRFDPDEAGVTRLRSNNIHGMGVGYLLTTARWTGADPEVVVLAVQVGDVRPVPDTLTPEVAAVVPEVARMAREEALRSSGARRVASD
jgi:hydrogenase maturation protease